MDIFKKLIYKNLKALTLVELLISVSIIAVLSTISISAYPKFSRQLEMSRESYRLLAWLRETQTYGISSYAAPGERYVYGIEFDKNNNSIKRIVADTKTLVTDSFGINSKFTNTAFVNAKQDFNGEETNFVFKGDFAVKGFCAQLDCIDMDANTDIAYIAYRRPNPEARIFVNQSGVLSPSTPESGGRGSKGVLVVFLEKKNRQDVRKKVIILQTGQMYVQDW